MPQPKMVCHDCTTVFNQKDRRRKVRTECWDCGSASITPVTSDNSPPPDPGRGSTPPEPPDIGTLRMPVIRGGGGGGITPEMLALARRGLKRVQRAPVELPGPRRSSIPRGVRVLAHAVHTPVVGDVHLRDRWRFGRSGSEEYIYASIRGHSIGGPLSAIARGTANPEHRDFGDEYRNRGAEWPTRRGSRSVFLGGLTNYEYGRKTRLSPSAEWFRWNNGVVALDRRQNETLHRVVRQHRDGKTFSERLISLVTGEVFHTPDRSEWFYRYHPGARAWYAYRSAGGSQGPTWDESFYDDPYGS